MAKIEALTSLIDPRLIRFLAIGVVNTLFGYSVFGLGIWLGLASPLALFIATCVGILFNFFTTGRFVFSSSDPRLIPRFIGAYGFTYLFNLVLLVALERTGLQSLVAQALCIPPTVVLSFLILKRFVFGRQ
ncbi:GtrA family protein [Sphingomonas sp. AOB5]|uniref:GtrA family protein n=1 Tax=Sphingomonas sp. AOB5 TaxID=3034017 RepID=UPI0023F9F22A|nr:GtrA family protein [Sphingomonas sp. AOB5]MDF7774410.1 GtrA family protein [Sphingomonas sp. AOB5]